MFIKENWLRKIYHYKVYVTVFVCFTVKAIHLELVSDLSAEFIVVLNRFVARCGLPTDIYSDCGTNFVGVANQLHDIINYATYRDQLMTSVHYVWHFNSLNVSPIFVVYRKVPFVQLSHCKYTSWGSMLKNVTWFYVEWRLYWTLVHSCHLPLIQLSSDVNVGSLFDRITIAWYQWRH